MLPFLPAGGLSPTAVNQVQSSLGRPYPLRSAVATQRTSSSKSTTVERDGRTGLVGARIDGSISASSLDEPTEFCPGTPLVHRISRTVQIPVCALSSRLVLEIFKRAVRICYKKLYAEISALNYVPTRTRLVLYNNTHT